MKRFFFPQFFIHLEPLHLRKSGPPLRFALSATGGRGSEACRCRQRASRSHPPRRSGGSASSDKMQAQEKMQGQKNASSRKMQAQNNASSRKNASSEKNQVSS